MKFDNKGFSLVEIVMVISIIAIWVAVIIPFSTSYKETVKKVTCDIRHI